MSARPSASDATCWPVTGALISGIMLGVRKGKLRDIEKRDKYSKRLRWDPYTSQFVF